MELTDSAKQLVKPVHSKYLIPILARFWVCENTDFGEGDPRKSGWNSVGTYEDQAISGAKGREKRPPLDN